MALKISVVPAGNGWAVRSSEFENELVFQAGSKAEAAARELARRCAASGLATDVDIFLRDGALAGRFHHAASMPA